MRKFYLLCTLVLTMLLGGTSFAQDYSNKGKDFWISYPEHINGTGSIMGLYLTSNVNTVGSINDNGTIIPFAITANNMTIVFLGTGGGFAGPNSYIHLGGIQDGIKTGAAVHIISALPIVVYAHIINNARSGATLSLPTTVWGKEYIVPSYANNGNGGAGAGYGELNIMASLPNTQVEITPSITTRNGARPGGVPYTITLVNPGDVYQVQFPQNSDLSGTKIKSVAAAGGSGCQPIAVISASTWSAINCGSGNGGDNFYQQLFPSSAWGRQFFTTPLKKTLNINDHNDDIVRVFVKDPSTVVKKTENGVTTVLAGLTAQGFYEYATEFPTYLDADKPVEVFEYVKTQMCNTYPSAANPTQSDPEMITLSSVEQTINDITVYSAVSGSVPGGNSAINIHYINVVMKSANTATFTINGALPGAPWLIIPGTNYSYLKQNIPTGTPVSRLKADSAFSAYAYGFGQFESYGYNAGTNVRDLTQQLELETNYGNETSPTVCTFSNFRFKVYFPDSTLATPPVAIRFDSLKWDMTNRAIIVPNNFPVTQINPTIDSTNIRNGRQVNWYSLPGSYFFNTAGFDTLVITGYKSTNEGCGTDQDYEFPIQIFDPPTGSFTWTTNNGCSTLPVQFNETTPQLPKTTYRFWWDFGDPASGPANNSTLRNPTHLFSGPGTFTVSYVGITTPGCLLDTIRHNVTVTGPPAANFSASPPYCINVPIQFTDLSVPNGGTITQWDWTFGDGGTSTAQNPIYTYVAGGTWTVTLQVKSNTGCPSAIYSTQINVGLGGVLTLTSGTANQTVCINNPITTIVYQCSGGISGGSVSGLPTGVTGSFAGGVITILGTPTQVGTFIYTISTTGPCAAPDLQGTIIVNDDATITLVSAPGTDNQTRCINTAITNIDYLVGGGGTGATINWIPAAPPGISFISLGGGNFRIAGTPTAAGTYDYTISTTGPCIIPTATGRLIVTPDATVTLRAGDNNNQTVCINTPIATIRYDIGGSGTGGTVSGLPTGVTGSYAANVITILGTPTVPGVFTYTINPTGPCAFPVPAVTGTITVNADATITLTSGPGTNNQTKCINTAIANIDYLVGGGGTGATINWIPAAPPGISFISLGGGNFRIAGTPTAAGTYDYTISTTGPCIIPTATGRLIVTPDATVTLRAGDNNNQTVCINTPIATIRYDIGGSGTGGTVSGLPTGVTGSYAANVITILGTPTVPGVFTYTINPTGPCAFPVPAVTGTITVNADATITLTSGPGTNNQTKCINTAITNIDYLVGGGGTGATINWIPAAPPGISFISLGGGNFRIAGTPTAAGTYDYTISTTGPCIIPTATGRLIVPPDATVTLRAGDNNNQTVCINTPIATIRYDIGGSGTGGTVSGLPTGVTGSYAANVITILGTPTVPGVFTYTINPTGPCAGPVPPVTGTITVNADATITLTSGPGTNNQTKCINTAITNIDYSVGGGGTGATINWIPAAPPGINFISLGGGNFRIAGTPTAAGTYDYTISTTGPCIIPTATGRLIVTPDATAILRAGDNNNQTVCINVTIANIRYDIGGSGTGAGVVFAPPLPGVTGNYAANVLTISGTPTQAGTFLYTVTPTGPCPFPGPPVTGTITVNADATITLTSGPGTNNQTKCINTAITNIDYSVGGGGTGATINWIPAAPPGISFISLGGGNFRIAGTPTAAGTYDYTISTTGPCIIPTATGRLIVTPDATVTLRAGDNNNQTVCINTPIATIRYDIGGSGTGGTVSGLPTGVTGSYAANVITILGTPTVPGVFTYTINPTGPCAFPVPAVTGTITVNADATITLTSGPGTNNQTRCINTPIADIDYSVGGGGTGATINWIPAAPPGITFTPLGGGNFKISGTPTAAGTYDYTISTTGPCIIPTATGRLIVTQAITVILRAGDNNNQTVCINTPIATIRYDIGGSGTGGTVSGLPTGVTGSYAANVITILGTPTVPGVFTYTINPTGPCAGPVPPVTGTITVNADATITLTSAAGTNNQTKCINTAIADIDYLVGGGGTGATINWIPAAPPGITFTPLAGGNFKIAGASTAAGTYDYTISTTGPCIIPTASGRLIVTPDATLTLRAGDNSNQTVCINTTMASIRYDIGGSGTGASITSGSLPAGVTGVFSGAVFTISGTPTVAGTFNFIIGSTGPCFKPAQTGTITVNPDHTISLSSAASTTSQTVCSDRLIAPIAYTLGGGATGATVTGLPPGVTYSISGSTLTIAGAPTTIVGSPFNYSIITTGNSCITASKSGTISVLQTPAVVFNPVAGVCADVPSFQVTATPALGVFSGPGINAAGLFNPAVAGPGDHIIRYTYTAANGCPNFKEQTLSVFPMPPTNAGPDKFMLEGGQVTLTPALNASMPVTYSWTPNFHLNDPNIAYTIASPPYDFTYTLRVTTDKGCSKTDDVFVKVLKAPAIPNIFSPNGDAIHDTWVIQYLETYPGCTVDIFNRYGQKIYHSEGYTKPWDGTIGGKPVPIGTYYYIVDPKNGRKIMSGYVDVIR